jgi:predicted transglutaminase-like cysteine proteinase
MRASTIRLGLLLLLIGAGIVSRIQRHRAAAAARTSAENAVLLDDWTEKQVEEEILKQIKAFRSKKGSPGRLEQDPLLKQELAGYKDSRRGVWQHWAKELAKRRPELVIDRLLWSSSSQLKHIPEEFMRHMTVHDEITNRYALYIRPFADGRQGYEAVLALSHREESFTPEALNQANLGILRVGCVSCGTQHRWMPTRRLGFMLQDCSECGEVISLLGTDNSGAYRYAHEFLIGYNPPAVFPTGMTKLEEAHKIWLTVWEMTRYVSDGKGKRDCWQTGPETMAKGTGDCEDFSFLLADWLISRGIEAKVALGYVIQGVQAGGHAWVVARIDGTDYLLESTEKPEDLPSTIPQVKMSRDQYVPFMLLERGAYYVLRKGSRYDGNCWSNNWQRRMARPLPPELAHQQRDFAHFAELRDLGTQVSTSSAKQVPPTPSNLLLSGLKQLPANETHWVVK